MHMGKQPDSTRTDADGNRTTSYIDENYGKAVSEFVVNLLAANATSSIRLERRS
jgi:hypothetical protein